jgi:hypothetical protein
MTRIVVMDEELHESITVVDIPASFIRAVESGSHPPFIHLAITRSISLHNGLDDPTAPMPRSDVRLRLEAVMRGRDPRPIFWYAYADDPTLALELRAAFMPGQISEVRRREKEAYWRGAFAGLSVR